MPGTRLLLSSTGVNQSDSRADAVSHQGSHHSWTGADRYADQNRLQTVWLVSESNRFSLLPKAAGKRCRCDKVTRAQSIDNKEALGGNQLLPPKAIAFGVIHPVTICLLSYYEVSGAVDGLRYNERKAFIIPVGRC